jgi:hypothetical protein
VGAGCIHRARRTGGFASGQLKAQSSRPGLSRCSSSSSRGPFKRPPPAADYGPSHQVRCRAVAARAAGCHLKLGWKKQRLRTAAAAACHWPPSYPPFLLALTAVVVAGGQKAPFDRSARVKKCGGRRANRWVGRCPRADTRAEAPPPSSPLERWSSIERTGRSSARDSKKGRTTTRGH